MKFSLSFKTPDVLEQLEDMDEDQKMDAEETARKFLSYSEYISVEFDTELQTATVKPGG